LEVNWLGEGCFRLRNRDTTIILDPPAATSGARSLGEAQIVVVSDDRPADGAAAGVQGKPRVIAGPGEYEVAGVLITGVRTTSTARRAEAASRNVCFVIEMDEVRLCYLGRLGHVLSPDQVEVLNGAEVLLVPVGGNGVLDAAGAAEIVSMLEPRIVVPMHYQGDGAAAAFDPLDRFLKQMGTGAPQPVARLNVTRTSLPLETTVTVLENRR
jgi:L-ascorbate metabolism protein UlaG (beta-lactamase superfamily)